jgi:inhibitor of KinA
MRIEPLGELAWILRDLDVSAYDLAASINSASPQSFTEAVASYDSVGIYTRKHLSQVEVQSILDAIPPSAGGAGNLHEIPVVYDGEDLQDACGTLSLSVAEVVAHHTSVTYRCFAVGFCPGFAYLGWLPEALQGVPRRESPRVRVPAGSVAITGKQTGVYPLVRPGGWALIGRTPLTLVDVSSGYFPIAPGDEVHFTSISVDEFEKLEGKRL